MVDMNKIVRNWTVEEMVTAEIEHRMSYVGCEDEWEFNFKKNADGGTEIPLEFINDACRVFLDYMTGDDWDEVMLQVIELHNN